MYIPFSDYAWGAGVATALVNTSPDVRSTGDDGLATPTDLRTFLVEHALGEEPHGGAPGSRSPSAEDLGHVLPLRREVRSVLEADGEEEAVAGANALVGRAGAGSALRRDAGGQWQWCAVTRQDATLAEELACVVGVGLLGVVRALSHERFRRCASPRCSGMFVDVSRAGRRRYCVPEVCGNRVNVAAHRARRRGGTGS
ncbi:CGNR zinc finger domain-containing protein [Streptomyces sp. ODS28]|uniref:CGNR zinc finger domain-containing protein n=1 Tax=Streptomyces sp. ODS28 TaxID=3136688 RepID=UPI0031ED1A60